MGHHRPGRGRADRRKRRCGGQLRRLHQRRRRRERRGGRVRGQCRRPGTHRAGLRARRRPADPRLHRLSCSAATSVDGEPRPYEPSDEPAPRGVYARSKLAGEQAVLAALPEAVVVRTAWVYTGGTGKDFVAVMRTAGRRGRSDRRGRRPDRLADLRRRPGRRAAGGRRRRVRGPHPACRQRGRGLPLRAGPRGVRRMRRRPAAGAAGQHRAISPAGAAAGLLRAVWPAVGGGGLDAAKALAQLRLSRRWRQLRRQSRPTDRYPLRVTDVLPVVTVTYSPGPHLERFLASLSLATERPVSVLLADNGSTDGTPQAAVERYPNVRLFDTGANLGYGTAVNRAVAQLDDGRTLGRRLGDRGQPGRAVGPGQHRRAAGRRRPAGRAPARWARSSATPTGRCIRRRATCPA